MTETNYDRNGNAQKYSMVKNDYSWFFSSFRDTMLRIIDKHICKYYNNSANEINIIDVGCGEGLLSRAILKFVNTNYKHIKTNIIGIDISIDQINRAKQVNKKYGIENIKYVVGDAKYLKQIQKYKNRFDIALSFWCLNHSRNVIDLNHMISSLYFVLKKNNKSIVIGATMTATNDELKLLCNKKNKQIYKQKYSIHISDELLHIRNSDYITGFFAVTYFYFQAVYMQFVQKNGFKCISFLKSNEYCTKSRSWKEQRKFIDFMKLPNYRKIFVIC